MHTLSVNYDSCYSELGVIHWKQSVCLCEHIGVCDLEVEINSECPCVVACLCVVLLVQWEGGGRGRGTHHYII